MDRAGACPPGQTWAVPADRESLQAAIETLEAQRATLGDAVAAGVPRAGLGDVIKFQLDIQLLEPADPE